RVAVDDRGGRGGVPRGAAAGAGVAMTAPLLDGDTTGAGLATAAGCGVAFGAALERAGLGSARKLVGQFYAADFTVFQVMFTAIVVAMLGVFWLGWLGVLDVSRVWVPEHWRVPQPVRGPLSRA